MTSLDIFAARGSSRGIFCIDGIYRDARGLSPLLDDGGLATGEGGSAVGTESRNAKRDESLSRGRSGNTLEVVKLQSKPVTAG